MADSPAAEHAPAKGGAMGILTRKVGPLPLFVWVIAVAGIGYYLYRRSHPASSTNSSTDSTGTAPTDQSTYVPGFDAASQGGGGIGSTSTPGVVNNYYYGDTAAGQASGGGTSSTVGPTSPAAPPLKTIPVATPPDSGIKTTPPPTGGGAIKLAPIAAGSYTAVQPPRGKVVAE